MFPRLLLPLALTAVAAATAPAIELPGVASGRLDRLATLTK